MFHNLLITHHSNIFPSNEIIYSLRKIFFVFTKQLIDSKSKPKIIGSDLNNQSESKQSQHMTVYVLTGFRPNLFFSTKDYTSSIGLSFLCLNINPLSSSTSGIFCFKENL